jgi:hypothetical protein
MGQEMIAGKLTAEETTINIASLPSGIYLMTIKSDSGEVVMKVVKL